MMLHVRIPKQLYLRQRPVRAAARFYRLLDSGSIRVRANDYAGRVALNTVAEEFGVPAQTMWRWIREYTDANVCAFV